MNQFGGGGVVYDLHMLAEGLVLSNHEVYAIDPGHEVELERNSNVDFDEIGRYISTAKVKLHSPEILLKKYHIPLFENTWISKQYSRFRSRYRALDGLLSSEKFDVIVLYSVARMGLQTIMLSRKYNIPIIFRNVDMLYKLWPSKFEQHIVRLLEMIVYRNVHLLCALTPKYAEYLKRHGANPRKIELILFPVDTIKFNPAISSKTIRKKWNILPSEKVILFMGALYQFGGVELLLESVVMNLHKLKNTKILIVGDGVIREKLMDYVKKEGLEKYVIMTGYQSFDMMPEYIALANVCINVFPINKFTQDIFSAKIVQYLAVARATVSSALPGITTLIPPSGAGLIYCNNVSEVMEKAINLLEDDDMRDIMGASGRKYVMRNHSLDQVLISFESVLNKVARTVI